MKKRILTFLLAALMIFSTATLIACGDQPAETTPTATTTTKPPKGVIMPKEPNGTEADPFLINNADDLKALANKVKTNNYEGKIFKLTADIQLNDTSVAGWYDKEDAYVWTPFSRFGGILDGAGHTIEGLLIKGETKKGTNWGFINFSQGATLKNINFYNGRVNVPNNDPDVSGVTGPDGAPSTAFLAGDGNGLTVENCIINATFDCPQAYGVAPVGFLAGPVNFKDSLIVIGYAVMPGGYGSVCSGAYPLSLTNTLIASGQKALHWIGGDDNFKVENSYKLEGDWKYQNGVLKGVGEAANVLGDAAKAKLEGFDFENAWIAVNYDGKGYLPVPKIFADIPYIYLPIQ